MHTTPPAMQKNIINRYKLQVAISTDSYVYMEIRKGMYRVPQVRKLANDKLKVLL